jgi:uncharacterized membrane protein
MTYCAQCGTEVTGAFCPQCGAAANAGGPQATYAAPGSPVNPSAAAVAAPGMSENVASALCYLLGLVTGIIFLVLAPYNQNRVVRFHAFQAIFFHVGAIILWIGLMIVMGLFGFITHGLSVFFSLFLYPVLGLALFITWLYLMYAAYSNKMVVLPIIGPLAQKQA